LAELISIPHNLKWDVGSNIKVVRIPHLARDEFQKATRDSYRFYSKKSHYLTFKLESISDVGVLEDLHFRDIGLELDVYTKDDVKQINSIKNSFAAFDKVEIVIHENSDSLYEDIKILLEEKNVFIRLSFELLKSMDEKSLNNFYEKIAFTPDLLSKIYPFISIVRFAHIQKSGRAKGMKRTLWRFMQEEAGLFYYVDSNGKIGPSKRLLDKGLSYGTIENSVEDLKESALYKELNSIDEEIFFTYDKCSMCESYDMCNAMLKFGDLDYDCSAMKNIITSIKSEIEDIESVQKVEFVEEGA